MRFSWILAVSLLAPELTYEHKAEFLRSARVVEAREVGKGVTATWRLTLKDGSMTHDASFQSVDRRELVKDFPDGRREVNFVDSYRYNIAAYRLSKLVGLEHMVPVSVKRSWRANMGALTWWVDDVRMDEAQMNEKGIQAPDQSDWAHQIYRVRVFTELIHDTDRNQGNLLVTTDWKIWMIDFTRAFRRQAKLRKPEELVRCDGALLLALKALAPEDVRASLSDVLKDAEIDGILARRDLIVAHYEEKIRQMGADQILY